jgi:hypothetical protein
VKEPIVAKLLVAVSLLLMQSAASEGRFWLTPVSAGDCVGARIFATRTIEWEKKRCAGLDAEQKKTAQCMDDQLSDNQFVFFTDRCSEEQYYIGIDGKEHTLRMTSTKTGTIPFIGSFAGEGVTVRIDNPRLRGKAYEEGQPKTEDYVIDADYDVRVTITKGALKKTLQAQLWYGR